MPCGRDAAGEYPVGENGPSEEVEVRTVSRVSRRLASGLGLVGLTPPPRAPPLRLGRWGDSMSAVVGMSDRWATYLRPRVMMRGKQKERKNALTRSVRD